MSEKLGSNPMLSNYVNPNVLRKNLPKHDTAAEKIGGV